MKIKRCRLSCLWSEPLPELLGSPVPTPFVDITNDVSYAAVLNSLFDGVGHPTLDLPWSRKPGKTYPERNHFWDGVIMRTIRTAHSGANRGKLGWKAGLPFAKKEKLLSIRYGDRCFVEAWHFPIGIAISVTVWLSGDLDKDHFLKAVSEFQNHPIPVTWADGTLEKLTLDVIARRGLDSLRRERFGLSLGEFLPERKSILTVIAGEHEGRTSTHAGAAKAMLTTALAAVGAMPADQSPPDQHIYGTARSRVIWRPDCFLAVDTGIHTLGCLHRNVTMATLHVAGLSSAAEAIAFVIDNKPQIPPHIQAYAEMVAGLLGRIYGQKGHYVYKLPCLKSQIDQIREEVDLLRRRVGMAVLQ